jgi:hypothetical protein
MKGSDLTRVMPFNAGFRRAADLQLENHRTLPETANYFERTSPILPLSRRHTSVHQIPRSNILHVEKLLFETRRIIQIL